MALLLVMPCPRCGHECTIQPDFNFVQLGQCDACARLFQFSIAVRAIDKSNAGEVRTGKWKVLRAPTVNEIRKNGDIFFQYGPEQDDPEQEQEKEQGKPPDTPPAKLE